MDDFLSTLKRCNVVCAGFDTKVLPNRLQGRFLFRERTDIDFQDDVVVRMQFRAWAIEDGSRLFTIADVSEARKRYAMVQVVARPNFELNQQDALIFKLYMPPDWYKFIGLNGDFTTCTEIVDTLDELTRALEMPDGNNDWRS